MNSPYHRVQQQIINFILYSKLSKRCERFIQRKRRIRQKKIFFLHFIGALSEGRKRDIE